MKLIRLKLLEEYRNLKPAGFEINFHNPDSNDELTKFHPFCLTGLNGSGKSNVLEALANIFYHLECCTKGYPEFAYNRKESSPNAYELEYFIANDPNNHNVEELNKIKITKTFGKAPTMLVNEGKPIEINKGSGSSFLPDLVVAYSSGENETLSLPFVKMKLFQYDEYLKDFISKSVYEKPKSSLLYINYEMSQAVLLTILLFFDEDVLKPLDEELGIKGISQFTINLKNNLQKLVTLDASQIQVESIYEEGNTKDIKEDNKYIGRVLDHLKDQIDKFKDCATCKYIKEEYMSLDFWVDSNTKKLIRDKFENDPYKFFSVFQMLQALNERVEYISEKKEIYNSKGYYTNYKRTEYSWFFYFTDYFVIQRESGTEKQRNFLLKQLSDGEQQFLHTLGICLMVQNKRTLLLLDEPETHFNPDWRSKFINILQKVLQAGGDNFLMKDVILTSHSPFIISDCLPNKVIKFTKTEKGVTAMNAEKLDFKTFGSGVDYILQKFFGVKSLVSDYSRDWIKNIIKNGTDEELKKAINFVGESDIKQFLFSELYRRKNVNF